MSDYQDFLSHVQRIETYERIWRRLDFDRQCCTSPEGLSICGKDAALISRMLEEEKKDPLYIESMRSLSADGSALSGLQKAAVDFHYDQYKRDAGISPEIAQEFAEITGDAFDSWMRARKANRFELFAPDLERVISMTRKMALMRNPDAENVYDVCLDLFERGVSVSRLDSFFDQVREKLCLSDRFPLNAEEDSLFTQSFPIEAQKAFSAFLLKAEGLPEERISLRETEHPFTQYLDGKDVRVTTHYYENDVLSNLYTVLHEGGHALLHLFLPAEFYDNGLSDVPTHGMHECISRFYENIIGRSMAFCEFITPVMQEYFPLQCAELTPARLYRYVNRQSCTPIRMDADEWSYCAHILVRYELEKAFMEEGLPVSELSAAWNEKYARYLHMEIADENRGVLQDVHWVDSIGYFPSYALGTVGGAQLLTRMNRDFDVFGSVRTGHMERIRGWLAEYAFPKMTADNYFDWIKGVTGQPLCVDDYAAYLNEKSQGLSASENV